MKKKSKKKKKAFSFKKILIILGIALLVGAGVYYFLTAEDENTKLTLLERQWIEKNKDTLVSIRVPNNLSVLSNEGKGVLFDYIDTVEDKTELRFNKVSYNFLSNNDENKNNLSILVINGSDELSKDDVLITEDNYVIIGKNKGFINELTNINGSKVAVLDTDVTMLTPLSVNNLFSLTGYASVEAAINAVTSDTVNYAILPRYAVMDRVISSNELFIKYNLDNYSNKIILRLGNNKRLNNILIKYLEEWKKTGYKDAFEESLMNYYVDNTRVTDAEKLSLSSRVYTYGYVKNSGYNINKSKTLYGLAGEYINTLSNMADMEIKYLEYSNVNKLIKAYEKGEIDIAFINFEYKNDSSIKAYTLFNTSMVGLSNDMINITDRNGLNNRKLYSIKDSYLSTYLKSNYNSNVTEINKYNDNISSDGILVVDKTDYEYYKNNKFSSYDVVFTDSYPADYYFAVKGNNKVVLDILDYVLAYSNPSYYEAYSAKNIDNLFKSESNFKIMYIVVLLIIIIPVLLTIITAVLTRSKSNSKSVKKEDVLKYTDLLTSLKNRNYLNAHIDEWDDTKVYPRTIIVVDLNNLKYVNDNYGHEEGNNLIKKAAAILINTQLEKSEIIRTDGNEFLIYLIGYNKTQINSYISKLTKEFEKLPYGFGAAVGYSMIEDEIKTIDDAMNEATLAMRTDKEQNYK